MPGEISKIFVRFFEERKFSSFRTRKTPGWWSRKRTRVSVELYSARSRNELLRERFSKMCEQPRAASAGFFVVYPRDRLLSRWMAKLVTDDPRPVLHHRVRFFLAFHRLRRARSRLWILHYPALPESNFLRRFLQSLLRPPLVSPHVG